MSPKDQDARRYFPVLLAIAGAFGFLYLYWVTAQGNGVTPDSTAYIETAQNILAGNGVVANGIAVTHFPPVYPLLLAAVGSLFQNDILQASRVLHSLLYGINMMLIGYVAYLASARNLAIPALAMLIFFASAPILRAHFMIWTEPTFITLVLVALILLTFYVVNRAWYWLFFASLACGLAITTRYIGLLLLPLMLFALLVFDNQPIRNRIKIALMAILVACIPISVWLIRNIVVADSATDRELEIHVFEFAHIEQLFQTVHEYALPIPMPLAIKALITVTLIITYMIGILRLRQTRFIADNKFSSRIILPSLAIVFSLAYIAFLMVSISFFDAATPLDSRIMLPVFVLVISVGLLVPQTLSETLNRSMIWSLFVLVVLLSAGTNLNISGKIALDTHLNGNGYASRAWNNSPTLSNLRNFEEQIIIYTNGPEVIKFQTGMDSVMIPHHTEKLTRVSNPNYAQQLRSMCEKVESGQAIIVYLSGIERWYLPTKEEVSTECNSPIQSNLSDGTIFTGSP